MTASPSQLPDDNPNDNFYSRLGLRPGVSVQDIRRAYRDLSKLYHPDTTELESAIATVKFQALNEAYATLSSPEKRLAYDYKIGYSRLSVMQPLRQNAPSSKPYNPKDSAYLDPTDRPLSPGELFALFILGLTFIACLILVFTMGLTKSELPIMQGATLEESTPQDTSSQDTSPQDLSTQDTSPQDASPQATNSSPNFIAPERHQTPKIEPFTI
ncbi:MAG: J domain-containing protein [Cyanobacteria bacterium P01_C01_bin.121]